MDRLTELSTLLKPAGGGLYLVSTGRAEQQALQRRFYDAATDDDVTAAFRASHERIATAKTLLLGVPSDVGAGFRRGANLGPQALRQELLARWPDWPERAAAWGVVDIGDVFVVPQLLDDAMLSDDQLARARLALYPDVEAVARAALPVSPLSIAERALSLCLALNPGAQVVLLGGDHSTAWPAVKALHDAGRRFALAQVDAHTDLLPERLGVKMCFATWTHHANELLGRGGHVVEVGIRATRYPREHWERTTEVRQFWAETILKDPAGALDEIVAAVKATGKPAYLSNDIDGTDASVADATGTPEPGGLTVEFVVELIRRLGKEVGLVGGDVMEVAPDLARDGGQKTVAAATTYLQETLLALQGARVA